jgi:hypothetical protein
LEERKRLFTVCGVGYAFFSGWAGFTTGDVFHVLFVLAGIDSYIKPFF